MNRYVVIASLMLWGCEGTTSLGGTADGLTDTMVDTGEDSPTEDAPECTSLWDCNPGMECGSMVICMDGECRPDLERVHVECPPDPPECSTDADCAVYDPVNCCMGCPYVAPLESSPRSCYRLRGADVGIPMPPECGAACLVCPDCFPQPIDAACVAGRCVAGEEGCPYLGDAVPTDTTTAELYMAGASFLGELVRVRGSVIAREPGCWSEDCALGDCCGATPLLDGVVKLEGEPCGGRIRCAGDERCPETWDCGALAEGPSYEIVGVVSEAADVPGIPTLHVWAVRTVEPEGLGGTWDVRVTETSLWTDWPGYGCMPPAEETGTLVAADDGRSLLVRAGLFSGSACHEYAGTIDGVAFEASILMLCEGTCQHELFGEWEEEGLLGGTYVSYDGWCHREVRFEATRR